MNNFLFVARARAIPALVATLLAVASAASFSAEPPHAPLSEEEKILHLLNRIGYGPRPGDPDLVRRIGINRYIDQQLSPERIDDREAESRLAGFGIAGMSVPQLYAAYPQPGSVRRMLRMQGVAADNVAAEPDADARIRQYYRENDLKRPAQILRDLQGGKIVRALYSQRQLQEVMTDFWYNHFNVYWGKGADKWLTASFESEALRPYALGSFRDLLGAVAHSPAMLFYLDNHLSAAESAAGGAGKGKKKMRGINENYARELMELHTLGVDGGYSQADVQEVARCFTGWSIAKGEDGGGFLFRPALHDNGPKSVLGVDIPAGGGAMDGERVIDILAAHPSTARFIATKLVRRFVSDTPPPSLVERVAAVYGNSHGDIRAMLREILSSDEFYAPEAYRAKIKSPFELAVSSLRALGGCSDAPVALAGRIAAMGQPLYLYQAPTGYPDRAEQWVSTGALAERLQFALDLAAGKIRGTKIDPGTIGAGRRMGGAAEYLLDRTIERLLAGRVSPQTREVLAARADEWRRSGGGKQSGATGADAVYLLGLVLGSPEFQRR